MAQRRGFSGRSLDRDAGGRDDGRDDPYRTYGDDDDRDDWERGLRTPNDDDDDRARREPSRGRFAKRRFGESARYPTSLGRGTEGYGQSGYGQTGQGPGYSESSFGYGGLQGGQGTQGGYVGAPYGGGGQEGADWAHQNPQVPFYALPHTQPGRHPGYSQWGQGQSGFGAPPGFGRGYGQQYGGQQHGASHYGPTPYGGQSSGASHQGQAGQYGQPPSYGANAFGEYAGYAPSDPQGFGQGPSHQHTAVPQTGYGQGTWSQHGGYQGHGQSNLPPTSGYTQSSYGGQSHQGSFGASGGAEQSSSYGTAKSGFASSHDANYGRWRQEQLSKHDAHYQTWRDHQARQYDDDYARFSQHFEDWRKQQQDSDRPGNVGTHGAASGVGSGSGGTEGAAQTTGAGIGSETAASSGRSDKAGSDKSGSTAKH